MLHFRFASIVCVLLSSVLSSGVFAQKASFRAGFDSAEYYELLKVSSRQGDSLSNLELPPPEKFKKVYRSEAMGLDNRWDLWLSYDSLAVISIRGTTPTPESWIANFYAAMVPAQGAITISKDYTFTYALSDNPRAAVHTGWLVGMAVLYRDIAPRIDSCYKAGIRNFYILGHSQGGAIAFLLTSHVRQLQAGEALPADISFKTYCSAAPKPGNLYYAYSYEHQTRGWAYNVVNSADWVPETPFTTQTMSDYNQTNPFSNAKPTIRKQPFFKRLAFGHIYRRLDKPPRKSVKNYQKYLGKTMAKQLRNYLPDFVEPVYSPSNNYARTGSTVVLYASSEYYEVFPDVDDNIWTHHKFEPYLYLTEKLSE